MAADAMDARTGMLGRLRRFYAVVAAMAVVAGVRRAACAMFVITMLAAWAVNAYLDHRIDGAAAAHAALASLVARSEPAARRAAMLASEVDAARRRELSLERLQRWRERPLWLLEALGHLPPGLYLTAVEQDGDLVTVTGVAESNQRVADLLRQFRLMPSFTAPRLLESRALEGRMAASGPASIESAGRFAFKLDFAYRQDAGASPVSAASSLSSVGGR